jgi:hypothetical protein
VTTIAWRPGEIAADTLVCAGPTREGETTKIAVRQGVLAAATGCSVASRRFLDWFRGGMRGLPDLGKDDRDAHGFLFIGDQIVWFTDIGCCEMRAPFYSAGSGEDFARAALAVGASPADAVIAAMRFDTSTGGRVQVLRGRA